MPPIYKNGNHGYIVKINYTDESTGEYKQILRCNKYTRTKTDAKQYELELLAKVNDNTHIEQLTFEELYYKFKAERSTEIKKNTMAYYENVIPSYVFPMFQHMRIDKITKEKIIKWKRWLQEEHDFKTIYLNNIVTCFSTIMNYAVKFYDLKDNPIKKVGKFKEPEKVVEDKIDYWTYDEFKVFIDCVYSHLEQQTEALSIIRWSALYTTYMMLFYSGLRRSEALALTYNDIIEVNGVKFLNVYKSINQRISPFEITTTKNKSSIRKVPICDELNKAIEEHKARCSKIYSFSNNFFVCGSLNPLAKNSLGEVKNKVEKECGVRHIRIHDFRHSYCSILINGGFPLLTISKLLGHSTTDITQKVYSHIYPNANLEVINFMNNLGEHNKK